MSCLGQTWSVPLFKNISKHKHASSTARRSLLLSPYGTMREGCNFVGKISYNLRLDCIVKTLPLISYLKKNVMPRVYWFSLLLFLSACATIDIQPNTVARQIGDTLPGKCIVARVLHRCSRMRLQLDLLADVARMGSRENRQGRFRPWLRENVYGRKIVRIFFLG